MRKPEDWTADRIVDRMQIQDVLHRYCRAIDRIQLETLASVFHPDARIENGVEPGDGIYPGDRDSFIANVGRRHPGVPFATHMVMNVMIDFLAPDRAFVESWCLAFEEQPPADGSGPAIDRVVRVRYGDVFARRDGDWRIARRMTVTDHILSLPFDAALAMPTRGRFMGRRDSTDPIAAARADLGLEL